MSLAITAAAVVLAVLTIAAIVVILLRSSGRIGPDRDAEAWSVRSPDAARERAAVEARLRSLSVEADVLRRTYVPPPRKGA